MHRIPLKLNEPSFTWDRSLPDYLLISYALNGHNVKDMLEWMRRIDIEQSSFDGYRENSAINNYNEAVNLLQMKDERAALLILDKIILYAPKEGRSLALSLRLRGSVYYTQNRFEGAANDFELLLYLMNNKMDDAIEVYAKLSISYFMLGKYDKAREVNQMLQKNFPKYRRRVKGSKSTPQEAEAERLYFTVQQLISQIDGHNTTPGPSRIQPQRGVYWSFLIPNSSAYGENQLYSQNNYSSNTVVLCEKPIIRTLAMPWVQCEQCLDISHHMYSCFDCRIKTYCSVGCMKSDILHKEECKGLRNLVVLMLNCQNLFRTFVELIYLVQRHMLPQRSLNQLKRAGDILTAMRTYAKDFDIPLLQLLGKECDYRDMMDIQFSTVLATSVKLAVFIVEKTNLVDWMRPAIDASHVQEMIIVGSILMQLQYHLQKEAFLISFDVSLKALNTFEERQNLKQRLKSYGKNVQPKKGGQNSTTFFYLNKEILSLKVSTYLSIEIAPPSPTPSTSQSVITPTAYSLNNFIEPALEYSDLIARSVLKNDTTEPTDSDRIALSRYITRLDFMSREAFIDDYVREFNRNVFNFFFQKKLSRDEKPTRQIVVVLGRDIQKFRHSCDPNIEIILLTNGTVLAKTLKPIALGEECFVAYRCRYYQYNCKTRRDILTTFDINCQCRHCTMPEAAEPYALLSNIYCVPSCKTEFGAEDVNCPKCDREYRVLLKEYSRRMLVLETACSTDEDEREVHKQWIVMDKVSEQLFPPYNEHRIVLRLKYTRFIALNNFVTQAFDLANELYYDLKKYYPEECVLFTYYPILLEALTLLQSYNIDQSLNNAPLSKLKEINDLAFTLIHAQLEHIRTHEKFDQACGSILFNYRMFVEWKEKMYIKDIDIETLESLMETDAEMPELQPCSA